MWNVKVYPKVRDGRVDPISGGNFLSSNVVKCPVQIYRSLGDCGSGRCRCFATVARNSKQKEFFLCWKKFDCD